MKVILDVMSGDLGCAEAVRGAIEARTDGVEILLCGDPDKIKSALGNEKSFEVIEARDVITMEDDPVRAVRQKPDSSIARGLRALKETDAQAFISPGNTGALLTGATLIVGRIRGVRRAAMGVMIPSASPNGVMLIDCGATAECTPEYLIQFAHMGKAYMHGARKIENPRVALINNGTEEHKGTKLQQETFGLLKAEAGEGRLDFVGNIECRDMFSGAAEVLVCDGFTGNAILKTIEGAGTFLLGMLKDAFTADISTKLAYISIKKHLEPLRKMTDYRETGATPIMGISKPVFKAHGASDAAAFVSAIRTAKEYCASGAHEELIETLKRETGGLED